MAEIETQSTMAEVETKLISTTSEDNRNNKHVFVFPPFPKINFPDIPNLLALLANFPLFKKDTKQLTLPSPATVSDGGGDVEGEEREVLKPDMVSFPYARIECPVLKLETEESGRDGPRNLWQVYAFGGFLVLRYIWGKWKESKANNSDKKESGDEEPTSTDD